jgi:hypothetical protein
LSQLFEVPGLKKTACLHPVPTHTLGAIECLSLGKTNRSFKKKELIVHRSDKERNKTQMKDRGAGLRQAKNFCPLYYAENDIND